MSRSPRIAVSRPMKREKPMDLNYLLFRQQVERSRAKVSESDAAREAHEKLASAYEQRIEQSTADGFTLAELPSE